MIEQFRHVLPTHIRFADLDAMGHLNNAKYATYAEDARIIYVSEVCGWSGDWSQLGMILAKITIEFKSPVFHRDALNVYSRCSRIGNKSFEMTHLITRQPSGGTQEIASAINCVIVAFDYASNQTALVPNVWRERMTVYEIVKPSV